jgi:hypothetical protein
MTWNRWKTVVFALSFTMFGLGQMLFFSIQTKRSSSLSKHGQVIRAQDQASQEAQFSNPEKERRFRRIDAELSRAQRISLGWIGAEYTILAQLVRGACWTFGLMFCLLGFRKRRPTKAEHRER